VIILTLAIRLFIWSCIHIFFINNIPNVQFELLLVAEDVSAQPMPVWKNYRGYYGSKLVDIG